jgi:hypothetical protein
MNDVGLRAHYLASVHAARMMVPRRAGLIVNVSSFGALAYTFNAAYGVGKAALDRLTADTAFELKAEGVAVVSMWPGLVRTEITSAAMVDATPGYRRIWDAYGESPLIAGRAVAILASDPHVLRRTGKVALAAEIVRRSGARGENGERVWSPRSFRMFARAALPGRWRALAELVPPGNIPMWAVGPFLRRFSSVLKANRGFRRA